MANNSVPTPRRPNKRISIEDLKRMADVYRELVTILKNYSRTVTA